MASNQILKDPPTTHPDQTDVAHYDGPAGGWGSVRGIARIFGEEWPTPTAIETLARQNKPHGFMCVSCSWAKPADYHPFEFCENGAKATLVGADHAPLHAGVLRQPHGRPSSVVERLRPRASKAG